MKVAEDLADEPDRLMSSSRFLQGHSTGVVSDPVEESLPRARPGWLLVRVVVTVLGKGPVSGESWLAVIVRFSSLPLIYPRITSYVSRPLISLSGTV